MAPHYAERRSLSDIKCWNGGNKWVNLPIHKHIALGSIPIIDTQANWFIDLVQLQRIWIITTDFKTH